MNLVNQNGVEIFGKKRFIGFNGDLLINEMKVCIRECC